MRNRQIKDLEGKSYREGHSTKMSQRFVDGIFIKMISNSLKLKTPERFAGMLFESLIILWEWL